MENQLKPEFTEYRNERFATACYEKCPKCAIGRCILLKAHYYDDNLSNATNEAFSKYNLNQRMHRCENGHEWNNIDKGSKKSIGEEEKVPEQGASYYKNARILISNPCLKKCSYKNCQGKCKLEKGHRDQLHKCDLLPSHSWATTNDSSDTCGSLCYKR